MPDLWIDVDAAVVVPVNLFPLLDDTDFKTIEEAVVYNSAGMDLVWNFVTTAGATTATAVTPTTAGVYDWTEPIANKGMYSIEIPASGGASINNDTEGVGWFTGKATGVLPWRGPTIGFRAAAINDSMIDGSAVSVTLGNVAHGGAAATLELSTLTVNDGSQFNNAAGDGVVIQAGGAYGHGLKVLGAGQAEGLYVEGGATGAGVWFNGGATSGSGLVVSTPVDGVGLEILGRGVNSGVQISGGATGHGMQIGGGATAGDGIYAFATTAGAGMRLTAAGNDDGLECNKAGTGKDIDALLDAVTTLTTYTGNTLQTADVATVLARIGDFAGTGLNTIKGWFQALFRKDAGVSGANTPSEINEIENTVTGAYAPATQSVQFIAEDVAATHVHAAAANTTTPPTVGAIATAVWQDATEGDFTAANSIGKSLYTTGVVPGGAGGLAIVGSLMLADVTQIHGSALSEAAGQLAAAFSAFFDVAAPTGTVNQIPAIKVVTDKLGGMVEEVV